MILLYKNYLKLKKRRNGRKFEISYLNLKRLKVFDLTFHKNRMPRFAEQEVVVSIFVYILLCVYLINWAS